MICHKRKDIISNYLKTTREKSFFHTLLFTRYLFKEIFIHFILWNLGFFIVLLSLRYIDFNSLELPNKIKYMYILVRTLESCSKMFDIAILCSCVSFYLKQKNSFNFTIIQSFGATSMHIIKPVVYFFILIFLLRVFVFQSIFINMYNYVQELKTEYVIKEFQRNTGKIFLKNKKFTLTDNTNNNMLFIQGSYDKQAKNDIFIKDATIVEYNGNDNIKNIFFTETLSLSNYKWIIKDAIKIDKVFNKKQEHISTSFNTKMSYDDFFKYEKSITMQLLTFYDNLKLILVEKKHKTNVFYKALSDILYEVIIVINNIVAVFLVVLFLSSNNRQNNLIKKIIYIFVCNFAIIRIFNMLSISMQTSLFMIFFAISMDILLLALSIFILHEKDWNYSTFFSIKNNLRKLIKLR